MSFASQYDDQTLTPTMRQALEAGSDVVFDQAFEDCVRLSEAATPLGRRLLGIDSFAVGVEETLQIWLLPQQYRAWYGPAFARYFLCSVVRLKQALMSEGGGYQRPICLAEELALDLMVNAAIAYLEAQVEDGEAIDDGDSFAAFRQEAFDDTDYHLLYTTAGADEDEHVLRQYADDVIPPESWWEPYYEGQHGVPIAPGELLRPLDLETGQPISPPNPSATD